MLPFGHILLELQLITVVKFCLLDTLDVAWKAQEASKLLFHASHVGCGEKGIGLGTGVGGFPVSPDGQGGVICGAQSSMLPRIFRRRL